MPDRLLDDGELHDSSVVANCAMNRERQLAGVNSYAKELGFNPLEWLTARAAAGRAVAWLDLCCGTGRPLVQAAQALAEAGLGDWVVLEGVDLVDVFEPVPTRDPVPRLVCAPVTQWAPERRYDLVTCVHGLHYVGDKLDTLARAASWLTGAGLLVADLDLASVRLPDGRPAGRPLSDSLRRNGFTYDPRRHRVTCTGYREVALPYTYLGADDRAGPNYTGQPAVDSVYVVSDVRGRR